MTRYMTQMMPDAFDADQATAVLFSGGLDSAVLLAQAASRGPVQPLYISVGLAWEDEELATARQLIQAMPFGRRTRPLASLRFDMTDVYTASHWAVRGDPPAYDTPDEEVYLEGRNIVLLAKAGVFMRRANIARVLIGPLAGNPFPDATAEFFDAMSRALSTGLAESVAIEAPFAKLHKADVIRLGARLGVPFELTLSCMRPAAGVHCGRCSKCRERIEAFRDAGIADPAAYAD
ncbi:MAG TPA: 7-cyano-7-deazaguanine synthase [Vicinamibacterales bacterium]|nr:7-cyano-7-deazaguanine synthase [Vicinamibacterales bacterium]